MTPSQLRFLMESPAFQAGYHAACAFEPRDKSKGAEWLRGFDAATADLARD